MKIISSYLDTVFNPKLFRGTVHELIKVIKQSKVPYDAIAFRGMSGAMIAPIIGYKLKIPIILVRKKNDGSHSGMSIEGNVDVKNIIIVDDFISSGATILEIVKALMEHIFDLNITGIFCYRSSRCISTTNNLREKHNALNSTQFYGFFIEEDSLSNSGYAIKEEWSNHELPVEVV